MHTYTVVLTRRGNNSWIPISEPLHAEDRTSLLDARRIAGRFCPILGTAHIIEREEETGQTHIVATVSQREGL